MYFFCALGMLSVMKTAEEIRLENARYLAEQAGGNATFAEKIERAPTQVSRIIGARATVSIGPVMARHIERCFGKPKGWLDQDRAAREGSLTKEEAANYSIELPSVEKSLYVPILSWVQAGDFCNSETQILPHDCERILCPTPKASPRTFALRVVGDSMTAPHGRSYPEGTIIFVDPDLQGEPGHRVIARTFKGHTFKQLAINEFNELYLVPLNPSHKPIMEENIEICGVVIGSYMNE